MSESKKLIKPAPYDHRRTMRLNALRVKYVEARAGLKKCKNREDVTKVLDDCLRIQEQIQEESFKIYGAKGAVSSI